VPAEERGGKRREGRVGSGSEFLIIPEGALSEYEKERVEDLQANFRIESGGSATIFLLVQL